MLEFEPNKRATAADMLKHSWLNLDYDRDYPTSTSSIGSFTLLPQSSAHGSSPSPPDPTLQHHQHPVYYEDIASPHEENDDGGDDGDGEIEDGSYEIEHISPPSTTRSLLVGHSSSLPTSQLPSTTSAQQATQRFYGDEHSTHLLGSGLDGSKLETNSDLDHPLSEDEVYEEAREQGHLEEGE
eukprot:TRINITY_DN11769_c0_g1_i15.p1 TRINITY_DN11769_c0_g1~~TRINITY_DN11769_c0_g1_i15.p1  ORF type:complete len:183 (-),score=17.99 TRINITY_DN11769_c0_g1_i15:177-725(-)